MTAAGVFGATVRGRDTVMTGVSVSSDPSAPGDGPVHKGMTWPSWIGRGRGSRSAPPPVDVGSRASRERLSPAALKAFFNIMARWKVRDEDARLLLGGVSNGPFYEMKRNPDRTLDADRLTRISYLVGIFKALGVLYSDALADAWIQRPNSNPLFGGATPLLYLIPAALPPLPTVPPLPHARRA